MKETIAIEWFLSALAAFWAFLSLWLWKLHDDHRGLVKDHNALAKEIAGEYMRREDVQAMTTDIKVDIRMQLADMKSEMRELMAAVHNKVDKP